MASSTEVSGKTLSHICFLCRLTSRFLFFSFIIGCVFSVLGKSTVDFIDWRINLSRQVMERSYMPLIVIALYALGIQSFMSPKRNVKVYWRRLTLVSLLFILLYAVTLISNAMTFKSLVNQSYSPNVSKEDTIELMEKTITNLNDYNEASKILKKTASQVNRSYKETGAQSIDDVKDLIIQFETTRIENLYTDAKKKFSNQIRYKRFETAKYTLLSILFIVFYSYLMTFFIRLAKYHS